MTHDDRLAGRSARRTADVKASSCLADAIDLGRYLIDAKEVGKKLKCSWRTVYRHADQGLIPLGVKVGSNRRWDAIELDNFIKGGCQPCRKRPKP
jgi:predicted DNA-binding transcriptional regulator AlpA